MFVAVSFCGVSGVLLDAPFSLSGSFFSNANHDKMADKTFAVGLIFLPRIDGYNINILLPFLISMKC